MDKEDDNHLTRENAIKSLCELLGVISTQNVFCTESPNGISLGMDVGEWSGYFIVMDFFSLSCKFFSFYGSEGDEYCLEYTKSRTFESREEYGKFCRSQTIVCDGNLLRKCPRTCESIIDIFNIKNLSML